MIVFFRHLQILLHWSVLSLCVVQGGFALALDLNQASRSQLLAVKGIGAKTADRILSARSQRSFASLEDFAARVPGFGPKKRQALREQNVTVGTPPIRSAAGNRPTAAPDAVPDRTQSLRNPVVGKVMPAMPMLIRPRPRQPALKDDRGTHADRPARPAAITQDAAGSAGPRNKIH